MKRVEQSQIDAAKEHLLSGNPLTRLEAMIIFGVSNLPEVVYELKKQGFIVDKKTVPFAKALVRVNKVAKLEPPANLPIKDIPLTEYWINR